MTFFSMRTLKKAGLSVESAILLEELLFWQNRIYIENKKVFYGYYGRLHDAEKFAISAKVLFDRTLEKMETALGKNQYYCDRTIARRTINLKNEGILERDLAQKTCLKSAVFHINYLKCAMRLREKTLDYVPFSNRDFLIADLCINLEIESLKNEQYIHLNRILEKASIDHAKDLVKEIIFDGFLEKDFSIEEKIDHLACALDIAQNFGILEEGLIEAIEKKRSEMVAPEKLSPSIEKAQKILGISKSCVFGLLLNLKKAKKCLSKVPDFILAEVANTFRKHKKSIRDGSKWLAKVIGNRLDQQFLNSLKKP